jgi:FkbM family methyltransferase
MPSPNLYGWKWDKFRGSELALKWARRDLPNLDRVVARVPRKRVAVQAGGNLGCFAKRLSMSFETIYTFEPAPALFPLMCANASEGNIVRFQAALGYEREFVSMSQTRRDDKATPAHEGITHVAGPGPIPTMRLDDLMLPVVDLIQFDLEGSELYALQGSSDTIARCRPVLCVEVNKSQGFVGLSEDRLRDYVTGLLGYRFVERLESDEVFVPEEWA